MNTFQLILDECLTALSDNTSTVDECLARYPQYARRLGPLLRTAHFLKSGRKLEPSHAFKAHSHFYLNQHLRFNPHHSSRLKLSSQVVLTLAILVSAFFISGTVHAQTVLPGDHFYSWKRASEEVWRTFAANPIEVDIALSERRLNEWMAVADDPQLSADAKQGYFAELNRLKGWDNAKTHKFIAPVIKVHQAVLDDAGLPGAELVGNYLTLVITPSPAFASNTIKVTNTARPTITPLPTFTPKPPTVTPIEIEPSATSTDVPTATATDVPTATATDVPTATATDVPTATATDAPTATPTDVPTATPTDIIIPPATSTATPTDVPTATPTDVIIPPASSP
jgi:hypothetical protein